MPDYIPYMYVVNKRKKNKENFIQKIMMNISKFLQYWNL